MGRPAIYPVQEFLGRRYYKRPVGVGYYRSDPKLRDCDYMHRDVWRHYKGKIPKGFHVHHKDGNPANNDISNLKLMHASEHAVHHTVGFTPQAWRKGVEAARTAPRDWKKAGYSVWENRKKSPYICVFCDKRFWSRVIHRKPLFCGQNCQKKFRRREAKHSQRSDTKSSS